VRFFWGGQSDAFEMFGSTLEKLINNLAQTDMHIAILFEVLTTLQEQWSRSSELKTSATSMAASQQGASSRLP
jgi:hypothetical protein